MILALLATPSWCAEGPRVQAVALFKNKAVLLVNGKRRVLKVGEQTAEGVTLVSADAAGATVEFDGTERKLSLDSRISAEFGQGAVQAVVRLVPGRNGHYFADGQINGNPIRFLVDTGASSVVISRRMARRIGLQYRVVGERARVNTASDVVDAYAVIFDEVKINALGLRNVAGMVLEGDGLGEALLGQTFLNRLDIHRKGPVLELRGR